MQGALGGFFCWVWLGWNFVNVLVSVSGFGFFYGPLRASYHTALEVVVKTETEKEPWSGIFSSEERWGEVNSKMCENPVHFWCSKQLHSHAFSTRKRTSQDTLFGMLGCRTFFSWNSLVEFVDVSSQKKDDEPAQNDFWFQRTPEIGRDVGDKTWWRTGQTVDGCKW